MVKEMKGNFVRSLISIVAGAAIYWVLMPHLPPAVRHQLYHIDLGLLLYTVISLAIFGLISYVGSRG